jgi:hypothetical protein
MNEKEQFEIFKDLMYKAMENPNEINGICMRVIISLSIIDGKTVEEFKEITNDMVESFEESDSLEEILTKVAIISKVMAL